MIRLTLEELYDKLKLMKDFEVGKSTITANEKGITTTSLLIDEDNKRAVVVIHCNNAEPKTLITNSLAEQLEQHVSFFNEFYLDYEQEVLIFDTDNKSVWQVEEIKIRDTMKLSLNIAGSKYIFGNEDTIIKEQQHKLNIQYKLGIKPKSKAPSSQGV